MPGDVHLVVGSEYAVTVGWCRWWGLHKFGVPIKMISLSTRFPHATTWTRTWSPLGCGSVDDIVLISRNPCELQEMHDFCQGWCEHSHMQINVSKTNTMSNSTSYHFQIQKSWSPSKKQQQSLRPCWWTVEEAKTARTHRSSCMH